MEARSTWGIELDMPFYTWASVIVNGRVVATDYAPDTGWLLRDAWREAGGHILLEDPFPLRLSMSVADGWTVDGPVGDNAGGVTRDEGRTGLLFVIVDSPSRMPATRQARSTRPSGPASTIS